MLYLLYCIVLYCIVLYCIVLYCIVLYCIVLYLLCFNSTSTSHYLIVTSTSHYLIVTSTSQYYECKDCYLLKQFRSKFVVFYFVIPELENLCRDNSL